MATSNLGMSLLCCLVVCCAPGQRGCGSGCGRWWERPKAASIVGGCWDFRVWVDPTLISTNSYMYSYSFFLSFSPSIPAYIYILRYIDNTYTHIFTGYRLCRRPLGCLFGWLLGTWQVGVPSEKQFISIWVQGNVPYRLHADLYVYLHFSVDRFYRLCLLSLPKSSRKYAFARHCGDFGVDVLVPCLRISFVVKVCL